MVGVGEGHPVTLIPTFHLWWLLKSRVMFKALRDLWRYVGVTDYKEITGLRLKVFVKIILLSSFLIDGPKPIPAQRIGRVGLRGSSPQKLVRAQGLRC